MDKIRYVVQICTVQSNIMIFLNIVSGNELNISFFDTNISGTEDDTSDNYDNPYDFEGISLWKALPLEYYRVSEKILQIRDDEDYGDYDFEDDFDEEDDIEDYFIKKIMKVEL